MTGEYERGLKRYRRSDDDEEGDGKDLVPRGPYDPHANAWGLLVPSV